MRESKGEFRPKNAGVQAKADLLYCHVQFESSL